METLRHVVVLLHIVGFAVTFGALTAEAAARRFQLTPVMDYGVLLSLATGLALAAPWPAGVHLNHPKIAVKLTILLTLAALLGIGRSRQRRLGVQSLPLFVLIGTLSLGAAAIAVLW